MSKLSELTSELKTLKAELSAKMRVALTEHIKEIFTAFPTLTGIRWQQYTPHFNDGEPCVFNVYGVYFRFTDASGLIKRDRSPDYDDGFFDSYDLTKSASALKEFEKLLQSDELSDLLSSAYGDGVQVTISPDGEKVEEYYHD